MALILALLLAQGAAAQTVANPSFETGALPLGSYNSGPVSEWNCNGTYGLWSPASSYYGSIPDGASILYIQAYPNNYCKQDLGTLPAGTYTFSVYVGNRGDKAGAAGSWTASAPGCTQSGSNGAITPGTFQKITQTCTVPAGDFTVTLSCAVAQCDFDMVSVASAAPPPPPPNYTQYQFLAQLVTCSTCDGTDNAPMATGIYAGALLSILQDSQIVCSGTLNASGQISCTGGVNMNPAFANFSAIITPPGGQPSLTPSLSVAQILIVGRSMVTLIIGFDSATTVPRSMHIYTQ